MLIVHRNYCFVASEIQAFWFRDYDLPDTCHLVVKLKGEANANVVDSTPEEFIKFEKRYNDIMTPKSLKETTVTEIGFDD